MIAYAFKLLLEFAAKRIRKTPSAIELEALDATLILAFLKHLEEKRGCSASTRNARLAAIRSFMRYAELQIPSIIEQSRRVLAIPMKTTDTKLVRHLSQQEMEALLRAPDVTERDGIRDRAMLHLAFAAYVAALLVVEHGGLPGPLSGSALPALVALPLLAWSRIVMGRHSAFEVAVGTVLGGVLGGIVGSLAWPS